MLTWLSLTSVSNSSQQLRRTLAEPHVSLQLTAFNFLTSAVSTVALTVLQGRSSVMPATASYSL